MAYRNSTYVAFHANQTKDPVESDIRYLNMMRAWNVRSDNGFRFIDIHEKVSAVRDTSKRRTLEESLKERLRNSKNMVLIIGSTTKMDDDWVPFEIRYAIDQYKTPIIAAYTGYDDRIINPVRLRYLWPRELETRIDNGSAGVIHIPFRETPLADAISQFNPNAYPKGGGLGTYKSEVYDKWGIP